MTNTYEARPWGNRRHLLPKRITYAFSMDINLALEIPFTADALAPVCWPPNDPYNPAARDFRECRGGTTWNTYRIPGVGEFVTSQGQRPDAPLARLLHADDRIVLSNRITGSLAGRLLLETDTPGLLRMDYTGVVNFKGWKESRGNGDPDDRFRDVRGSAFVSARQEIGSPKYRWLVHNQLIGICRIAPARDGQSLRWAYGPNVDGLGLLLAFNYDFYVGA